jgi:hypothetical protein
MYIILSFLPTVNLYFAKSLQRFWLFFGSKDAIIWVSEEIVPGAEPHASLDHTSLATLPRNRIW